MEDTVSNTYDINDRVKRESVIIAGGLKMASYRTRDPKTDEWSDLQFHATYNNTVMAVMGESSARLFAKFITDLTKHTES